MEPAARETTRIHHSRVRTSGKERRPRRGKGWTTWTELKGTLTAGREEKSKSLAERSRETAKENRHCGGGGWNLAERAGESVCYNVFGARDVDNIAGEFGDVG